MVTTIANLPGQPASAQIRINKYKYRRNRKIPPIADRAGLHASPQSVVESNPALKPFTFSRHKPEESVLYKVVQNNWLEFQDQVIRDTGNPLPDFVTKEFDEYLRCGILAHGFLRVQCETCHYEHLVAFSCKRRGFCPSCGGRRMSETAAHLVDSVLPFKPIRQWVISFPFPIRLCLAVRPKIMAKALDITHTTISAYYRKKANLPKSKSKTGAVTLIQRFGGSHYVVKSVMLFLNANLLRFGPVFLKSQHN